MKPYASDLSDAEWSILESLIPAAKPGGRPRGVHMRQILNGIFYVLRDAAYRQLSGPRRRLLNRRVAQALNPARGRTRCQGLPDHAAACRRRCGCHLANGPGTPGRLPCSRLSRTKRRAGGHP